MADNSKAEKDKNPEESSEEKVDSKAEKVKDKPKTDETKKDKKSKEDKKEDDDFKYIIRIANTDIDGHKKVVHGLTAIKGVGMRVANFVIDQSDVKRDKKVGDLSDKEIDSIKKVLEGFNENAPTWMVNHRKDMQTGKDVHLIGAEVDMHLRDEVNVMKKIRSYKGIRHERGLRCRGQRTRANNRTGLTLGVSRKRVQKGKD